MFLKPSAAFTFQGATNDSTGTLAAPGTPPTAVLTRNGTDDGAVTCTVTSMSTGRYKVVGNVPSGYAAGDVCQVVLFATVNGIAGLDVIGEFVVDTAYVSDVSTAVLAIKAKTDALSATPAADSTANLLANPRWQKQEAVTVGAYTKNGNVFTFTRQDGTSLLVTLDSSTAPTVRTPGN